MEEKDLEEYQDLSEYNIKPVEINEDNVFSPWSPFDYIYGKYEEDIEKKIYMIHRGEEDYKQKKGCLSCFGSKKLEEHAHYENSQKVDGAHLSPFRDGERLRILLSILFAKKSDYGAEMNVWKDIKAKKMLAFFPLHDEYESSNILHSIFTTIRPWEIDNDRVRNYIGEKVWRGGEFDMTY